MRTFRQNKDMETLTEFAMVFAFRRNIAKYFASSKHFKVMLKCLDESQFQVYFSAKGLGNCGFTQNAMKKVIM